MTRSSPVRVMAGVSVLGCALGLVVGIGGCASGSGSGCKDACKDACAEPCETTTGSGMSGSGSTSATGNAPMSVEARASSVPMQADAFGTLGYRVQWRAFPTMMPGGQVESVQMLGDALGVMESTGVFTVLEASSGQQRWSDQPAGPLTRFFGALQDDKHILVVGESELYVYDSATGAIKTKHKTDRVNNTHPVKVGSMIAFGTATGHVSGMSATNGFTMWGTGVNGSVVVDPVLFPGGTDAVFVSQTGEVAVLDVLTGRSSGRARMFEGAGAAVCTAPTMAFVASLDHSLYAYSRSSCQQVWRHRTNAPLRQKPTCIDGVVYCDLGESGGMTALNASTGKVLWNNQDVAGSVVSMRKGKLLVFDAASKRAALLDPAKGKVHESVTLTNIGMFVQGDGDVLYAVSPVGVVTKLAGK